MQNYPQTAPRILNQTLPKYVGQNVSVIGKVLRTAPGKTIIQTADKQELTVLMLPGSVVETDIVEFVGKVLVDFTLKEIVHMPVDGNFDLDLHGEALLITQKYLKIF